MKSPRAFAGRKKHVLNLVDELLTEGSCPVIYGDRGLGKSSLAAQLERIALGDVELLDNLGHKDRALAEGDRFITIRLSCSDIMKTPRLLFQALVNEAEVYKSLEEMPSTFEAEQKRIKNTFTLRFFSRSVEKEYKKGSHISFEKLTLDEKLLTVLKSVNEKYKRPILLIIDEIDRVADTRGLGGFIKNNSSDWLKFMLVGVANNISALLDDHESVERLIAPVKIERMQPAETRSIITKAQKIMHSLGVKICFSEQAKKKLVSSVNGFPWFLHVICQEALKLAYESEDLIVTEEHVELSIENLSINKFAQQFEDLYLRAVRDSRPREIVLRLMASWPEQNVPLADVYAMARQLKVKNPSQCKRHLTQEQYGAVLTKNVGALKNVIRFKNAMFKQYAILRDALYEDVEIAIDSVW